LGSDSSAINPNLLVLIDKPDLTDSKQPIDAIDDEQEAEIY
jgi:hypothetical protein